MELSVIQIQNKIYEIRGLKVMLDFDLAGIYGVETRTLKQAVKRNITRFPADFMFQLNNKEVGHLVSQNVIPSKSKFGGALPYAFTEQGVAMLSSILNSDKAINANIAIIRTFVFTRQNTLHFKGLEKKIKKLEKKYNKNFKQIFQALDLLLLEKQEQEDFKNRKRIGFKSS
jgi:hypothetical protein